MTDRHRKADRAQGTGRARVACADRLSRIRLLVRREIARVRSRWARLARGRITYPGYEHLAWEAVVVSMEPERLFSFTWHPYAVDPKVDYSKETPTLVEFRLEKTAAGTLLRLTESGFGKIPAHRFADALRMNERGWSEQMTNIERHVAS